MNQQLNELHLRRGRLLERIAAQRATLSHEAQPVRAALERTDHVLDRVRGAVVYVRTHPTGIAALALAALLIVKPKRALRWSLRAFSAWQSWRVMRDRFEIP